MLNLREINIYFMKGIVFTEFIEFVENTFGFEVADAMITKSKLSSGGIYTAVGTYDFDEMVSLLVNLNQQTSMPIPQLLEAYGRHLFFRFVDLYPHFLNKSVGLFRFIEKIDQYIHVEVKKLYPDAELPKIEARRSADNQMEMVYKSSRKLAFFALGLLKSASDFFEEPIDILMKDQPADGTETLFILTKRQ